MELTTYEVLKLATVGATKLFKEALHIHVALLVFFASALATRKPLSSAVPWAAVFAVMLFGEIMNMRQDLTHLGYWRWTSSLHGLMNSMLWPTVLLLVTRHAPHFFRSPAET